MALMISTSEQIPQACCDAPKPDVTFYLDTVTFQVEDRLFKVPKCGFAKSPSIFRTNYMRRDGDNDEGESDKTPLKLEGVSKVDFQRLLEVMFPFVTKTPVLPQMRKMAKDELISVLKLSTMWKLTVLRHFAINQLTSIEMTAIDKIVLAKTYNVADWLRCGCIELVTRQAKLSLEEAEVIGYLSALRIFQVREDSLKCGDVGASKDSTIGHAVEKVFEEDLRIMGTREKYCNI